MDFRYFNSLSITPMYEIKLHFTILQINKYPAYECRPPPRTLKDCNIVRNDIHGSDLHLRYSALD